MTGFRLIAVAVALLIAAPAARADSTITVSGLQDSAQVVRDEHDIPHIFANNEHDLFFLQGWITAEDRLFQMDVSRHQAGGRLAELLGTDSLADDVQLRQVGLRRAAEVTLPILSQPVKDALQAYADATHPLPPDYAAVEITHFEPWTALDCVTIAKLLAFGLSFDLTDMDLTIAYVQYQLAGQRRGFDANTLFFQDMFRIAPFDPAATVPDASQPVPAQAARAAASFAAAPLAPSVVQALQDYANRIRNVPLLGEALKHRGGNGSNEWVVAGSHTVNGLPMLASDPHQPLTAPSLFHQVHLSAPGLDVIGNSLEGAPLVVLGHNERITWGATVNPMDAVDLFLEKIVRDKNSPSGLSIVHDGKNEPIVALPQQFFVNQPHDNLPDDLVPAPASKVPANVLIVPRRNNGPLVVSVPLLGFGVSIQYTGFGPTREIETLYAWNHAHNLADFIDGLHHFDFGSQNFTYADVDGNIAYFTSGALPLREDLEAGHVNGLPPYFIRNGQTGNEWIPEPNPPPGQILPYKVLPFDEMPHTINPPAGFIVSANNDPNGNTLDNDPLNVLRPTGGILYLSPAYVSIRAGRITEMLRQRIVQNHQKLDIADMQAMQADVTLHDAEVFVPYILRAFANAQRKGAPFLLKLLTLDPRVVQAIGRLRGWDFTTPTGVPQGYDAADVAGAPNSPPAPEEIADSVAATIYAVWRSQALANIIDGPIKRFGLTGPDIQEIAVASLRHLLDTFDQNQGVGASGINFFGVLGIPNAADRRDFLLLKSVWDALNLLQSNAFAAAFHNSTNQNDYRWGRLHRIVFEHPLGGQFNFPPAGGAFPPPFADLAGIPTDGGFETVDASRHDPRAASSDAFMFDSGPANRFTSKIVDGKMTAETALPGGESGDITSPHYVDLLPIWLVNDTYPLRTDENDIDAHASSTEQFLPAVQLGSP